MNMRERLARAIDPEAMAPIAPEDDYPKERSRRAIARAKALTDADAVLDELMTPTEGMYQEGEMELGCHQIFTAMIKAAKEGK